ADELAELARVVDADAAARLDEKPVGREVAGHRREQAGAEAAEPDRDRDGAVDRRGRRAAPDERIEHAAQREGRRDREQRDRVPRPGRAQDPLHPAMVPGRVRALDYTARLAPWRRSASRTSRAGTSRGSRRSRAASAAHTPAACPVAMTIGITRYEECALSVPEMQRAATISAPVACGSRQRSGMSYASPGGRRFSVVPLPVGLWMSTGYEPRAMASSNL